MRKKPTWIAMTSQFACAFMLCACSSTEKSSDSPNALAGGNSSVPASPAESSGPSPSAAVGGGPEADARGTMAAAAPGGVAMSTPTPAIAGRAAVAGNASIGDATGTNPSAGPGTNSTAGAGGESRAPEAPTVACNPKDMLPEAKNVPLDSITGSSNPAPIVPAKGPLTPVVEHDPGLDSHTVYRPMVLEERKLPIVVWANGGCVKNGTMFARFLLEIASHGFVIVADGQPNGSGGGSLSTDGGPQKMAMDWIVAENERPCSKYYHKLDTTKIAAMGQSCGGLMTLGASSDPRLTTAVIWNSGLFQRDDMIYKGLHTPIAYIIGGPDDVAYPQAESDFEAINNVPFFYGNLGVGHTGTYAQDNGGEFAQVGIAWLKWQLYGEMSPTTSGMFLGADCALCTNSMWTVEKKMME